jgi:hypothetical protein
VGSCGVRTWLQGGCWFAEWCWVLIDGPWHWIPSVGDFHEPILSVWVVYPRCWVVAVGRWVVLRVVLWVFLRGGIDVGAAVLFDVARGGPVLVGFEVRCAWSG